LGIILYRYTDPGDELVSLAASERIDFNFTTDVKVNAGFITSYRVASTIGIGNNQAAEQDLGDHQDLGAVELIYILNGFVSRRDVNPAVLTNPITKLTRFDEQPKLNDNYIHGRFGIQFDDFKDYSLEPIGVGDNQTGLIWKGIDWNPLTYDILPLRADFQIQLIIDKGDDQ
jgi:hypothetical protein